MPEACGRLARGRQRLLSESGADCWWLAFASVDLHVENLVLNFLLTYPMILLWQNPDHLGSSKRNFQSFLPFQLKASGGEPKLVAKKSHGFSRIWDGTWPDCNTSERPPRTSGCLTQGSTRAVPGGTGLFMSKGKA